MLILPCPKGSLHLQSFDDGTLINRTEERRTFTVRTFREIDCNGVTCAIKSAEIVRIVGGNLGVVGAEVNVSREDGIGVLFTTIDEFDESKIVFRRSDLVNAVYFVQRIRRHVIDHHDGHQACVK